MAYSLYIRDLSRSDLPPVPVLEEALAGPTQAKVRYLEVLISSLDQMAEAGTTAQLITPTQRVLGLDFVPPHLVRGVPNSKVGPVFVDGKIRNLRAFDWWKDPSYVQKRMRIFHELVDAVTGHPALTPTQRKRNHVFL